MKPSRTDAPITGKQLSLIHVAKAKLKLTEEDYRNILEIYGGVVSAKSLRQKSFERVLGRFASLGFDLPDQKKGRSSRKGFEDDLPTVKQSRMILGIFATLGWTVERQRGFCQKLFKVFFPQTRGQASKLIETLKEMEARGYSERVENGGNAK